MLRTARRVTANTLIRAAAVVDPDSVVAAQWFETRPIRPTQWSSDPCANWHTLWLLHNPERFCPACHRSQRKFDLRRDEYVDGPLEKCLHCDWRPKSLLDLIAERL